MRKSLLIISLCLIGALIVVGIGNLFFGSRTPDVANYPSAGKNVIAFGDSLVEGVGSTEGNNFVSRVSRAVGVPILNYGVAGNTTRDGVERLPQVLENDPKVVLLLLGGNDYLRQIPREETFENLGTMIEMIQSKGAVVLLLGVRGGLFSDHFDDEYQMLALRYKTAFVPNVLDGLLFQQELMYDSIHPNDTGYAIVAERITPVLKPLLSP